LLAPSKLEAFGLVLKNGIQLLRSSSTMLDPEMVRVWPVEIVPETLLMAGVVTSADLAATG